MQSCCPCHQPLAERYERWQDSIRVPPEQVEGTVAGVIEQARAWTRGLVELPADEGVVVELVPTVLLEGDHGAAFAAVLQEAGIELDLTHALAVERALEPCRWAEVNAALMLYEAGASKAEADAYLGQWGLVTPELAAHLVRFLTEPTSRTYVITYPAGQELCRSYVAADPQPTALPRPADQPGARPRSARGKGRARTGVTRPVSIAALPPCGPAAGEQRARFRSVGSLPLCAKLRSGRAAATSRRQADRSPLVASVVAVAISAV